MKTQPDPGASALGGAPRYHSGTSVRNASNDPWGGAFLPFVGRPAQAVMATFSRCANDALSEQIRHVYGSAAQTRDFARASAALAATRIPPGPALNALVSAWARQEAGAERVMHEVLRFGREHGHLAFAFPVYR